MLAFPAAAGAQSPTGTGRTAPASVGASLPGVPLDTVVAVVNEQPILASTLGRRMANVKRALQAQGTALPSPEVLRHQVLERLITHKLMLQAAKRQGIRISADQVNKALSAIAGRRGLTLAELPKALASRGLAYAAFRRSIKDQLKVKKLVQQAVAPRVAITPSEVDTYLELRSSAAGGNVAYRLAQILVPFPADASPTRVKKARRQAEKLVAKIRQGADFAAVAVAHSAGPHALQGGMIGWIQAPSLPTLFTDVVPSLEVGEISAPIAGIAGFHIVKLIDKRTGGPVNKATQYHIRNILLEPNPIRSMAQSKALAKQLREQIKSGQTTFAAAAKKFSDDPDSAGVGGDLQWQTLKRLPSYYAPIITGLSENEISQAFKTPTGWELIKLVGKRRTNITQTQRQNRAYRAIFNRKISQQVAQFKRMLHNQAYVKIFPPAMGGSRGKLGTL